MRKIPKITIQVLLPLRCGGIDSIWRKRVVTLACNRFNSSTSDSHRQKVVIPHQSTSIENTTAKYASAFRKIDTSLFVPSTKDETSPFKKKINEKIRNISVKVDPYFRLARLDKPIGIWLLIWPCSWSVLLAADPSLVPAEHILKILGMMISGAFLMRGAGCTINDIWDRDIDKKVERTKSRPLANGDISLRNAKIFFICQLLGAFSILVQFNWYSILLGASSLGLVLTYPLAKRYTNYPQFVLGITFNWGALIGWSAVRGDLDLSVCLPLYAAGICWTLMYDTIYAHQDKNDDVSIGVKSTALTFENYTKPWLLANGAGFIAGLGTVGAALDLGWPYYGALSLVTAHVLRQIWTLNPNDRNDCHAKFVSNNIIGIIMFMGIILGKWEDVCKYLGIDTKNKNETSKLPLIQ